MKNIKRNYRWKIDWWDQPIYHFMVPTLVDHHMRLLVASFTNKVGILEIKTRANLTANILLFCFILLYFILFLGWMDVFQWASNYFDCWSGLVLFGPCKLSPSKLSLNGYQNFIRVNPLDIYIFFKHVALVNYLSFL